jgi:hypothetical protein
MPRQNRVTPLGEIIATPERGTVMGNRGVLHHPDGHILRPWHLRRWLLCVLEFRGRKRTVMTPGRYTELFFLDEATGLAAGHRPCAECRHADYLAFRRAWSLGNPDASNPGGLTAIAMDDRLHEARVGPGKAKRRFTANLDDLPDGVFVTLDKNPTDAWLLWGSRLLSWSPGGYHDPRPRRGGLRVEVLTPQSTVKAIRAGYVPGVHQSAESV